MPPRELPGGLVVYEARSPAARLLGLALLDELPAGCALLLPRCRSVHTVGMRFAIDVAFVDEGGRGLRVVQALQPRRAVRCAGASATLETPCGEAERFLAFPDLLRPARPRAREVGIQAPRAPAPR